MWQIDTPWFDVAFVSVTFAIGNILFGRFEEHRSRWRRIIKLAVTLTLVVTLATTVGRVWAYGWMAPLLLIVIWVHAVWLPRNGVNGWTAEPRDRYHALMARATLRDIFRTRPSQVP